MNNKTPDANLPVSIFYLKAQKFRLELTPSVNRLQTALEKEEIVDVFRALIHLNKVARPIMDELRQAVEVLQDE